MRLTLAVTHVSAHEYEFPFLRTDSPSHGAGVHDLVTLEDLRKQMEQANATPSRHRRDSRDPRRGRPYGPRRIARARGGA